MDPVNLKLENTDLDPFDIQILNIINEAIQPLSTSSAQSVALALDAIYNDQAAREPELNPEGYLLCFWELLFNIATQIPHDSPQQDRLVAVIKELQNLPSRTIRVWKTDVQLWRDLPLFTAEMPRNWEALNPDLGENERKQRFINLQAYNARILGLRLVMLEMYAIWDLSDAVEGAIIPVRGSPDIVSADPTAVDDLSFKAALAAGWIIHAGHVLYGRDEEIHGTQGGPLWRLPKREANQLRRKFKGTQGLCGERWKLWKQQFRAIRDCEGVDTRTRRVSRDAFAIMESLRLRS